MFPTKGLFDFSRISSIFGAIRREGSSWRKMDLPPAAIYPNYKPSLAHHRHRKHSPNKIYGIHSRTRLRVIDDSEIGRKAMAERRPPYVISVLADFHRKKPHGAMGKLGDQVVVAVLGEVHRGIIVGLKQNQLRGIPRFDSNNVVLIDKTGAPLGTRIHAPIPLILKKILKDRTVAKKADYTKILSIATRFV